MQIPDDDTPSTDAIFLVLRRLRAPLFYMITVMSIATVGLTQAPGRDEAGHMTHLSPFEAFYFISYTATTIGYGEIVPLSPQQRLWTTGCILFTAIGWAYTIGTILALMQSASFQHALSMQRFRSRVRHIREPFFIVCGYGQAGRTIAQELDEAERRFVIVDADEDRLGAIHVDGLKGYIPVLAADAAVPATLGMAGLANPHCEGVLALTSSDTDNLAIVMAARVLRPSIRVIARCGNQVIEERMHDFAPTAIINPGDRYGAYLILKLERPDTYRLVTWLIDPREEPLPKPHKTKGTGRWVVCANGSFLDEICSDLQNAGMDVTLVNADEDHPQLEGARGFIAGTDNDTLNLALAEHAKIENPDLFVAVRQQSNDRAAIVKALDVDSVFIPTDLVAQESLARIVTPLFWSFVEHSLSQPEEFAHRIIELMEERCGGVGKARGVVDLSQSGAPALHRWLEHDELTLEQILSDPDDRDKALPLVPLVLIRGREHIFAPELSMTVEPDDTLLVVGHPEGIEDLLVTQYSDSAAEYIATGREVPETWVWRRISRLRQHAS